MLRGISIAGALCVVLAGPALGCEMADFKGLDGLRLHRPVPGDLISGFGMRPHPLLRLQRFHNGLDFAAPPGEPVQAAAKGRVSFADRKGEYGNFVMIDHGGGLTTAYAHLSRIEVSEGECVDKGVVIGLAGSTGLSAGPQVHFEAHVEGKHVDPAPAVGNRQ
jgi:murein DD-endopeptidase MepM/ murein hydrolase activator NlpD